MTVLLALAGSLFFGGSDFLGGVASRRAAPLRIGAVQQTVALLLAVPTVLIFGWDRLTVADAAWSLGSGIAVAVGLGFFYSAMARGLISLVVPVTSVVSASVPVTYALVTGERPGVATFIGIFLAIVAIAVVSAMPGHDVRAPLPVLLLTLAGGGFFGTFVVLVSQASDDSGLWPVLFSRITSCLGLIVLAIAFTGPRVHDVSGAFRTCVAIGALEAFGMASFVLALQHGPLAVATVLSSLYPVGAVLLAVAVLHERLTRHQVFGVVLALCAVLLISVD